MNAPIQKSPKCKKIEVSLIPGDNKILTIPGNAFKFTYNSYNIEVNFCGIETITITSNNDIKAELLWSTFLNIHMLQAFGIGYFYKIDGIAFSDSETESSENLEKYANNILSNLVGFFNSSEDFRDKNLSLFESNTINELLNETIITEFTQIYQDLKIIFNGFWYQSADTKIPVDIRCANIIQCFEHFGRYIAKKYGEMVQSGLSDNIKHILKKYPLSYLLNNSLDEAIIDSFTLKTSNTRNRIMHYDICIKNDFFSEIECAGYSRVLHIYFRYVVLKLLKMEGGSLASEANDQIEKWQQGILKNQGC